MTIFTTLLRIGEIPLVHRFTKGRFHGRIHKAGNSLSPDIITTKDGYKIETTPTTWALRIYHEYEPDIRALMDSIVRPGDITVDVGANIGYHTTFLADRTPYVIAVEPDDENFELLERNLVRNRLSTMKLHHMAVSDHEGTARLWKNPENSGNYSIETKTGEEYSLVNTFRLDRILPLGRIRLIKIDVEGHELAVIKGLGDRLQDVDFIIYEHWKSIPSPDPAELLAGEGWGIRKISGENYLAINSRLMWT